MRGTFVVVVVVVVFVIVFLRFSPAHAGNICGGQTMKTAPPVQPRTCGEHLLRRCCVCLFLGSAPHMRGTCKDINLSRQPVRFSPAHAGNMHQLPPPPPRGLRIRFSPAHAGNMLAELIVCCVCAVQPRTCGEHSGHVTGQFYQFGSAPHMRGTYNLWRRKRFFIRFSPAHAGNIAYAKTACAPASVQPRTCGEHTTPRSCEH